MNVSPSTAPSTRDRMLDAAAHVMRSRGLARATTKEIAREAGFSEAALYRHFEDKTALFVAVLTERVPSHLGEVLHGLAGSVGRAPVVDVLTTVAGEAIAFYRETFPLAASVFSELRLLEAHRDSLRRLGTGPHVAVHAVADYLAREREQGRVRADADPRTSALLLLGACQMSAFLAAFDDDGSPPDPAVPSAIARSVVGGLTGEVS